MRIAFVLAFVVIGVASGCDEQSGILFRIQDSESQPPPDDMDRLQFFAAYVDGAGMTQDIRVPLTVATVGGRDLAKDPYDLLVTEDDHAGPRRQVSVAVVGYRGDTAVAFGIVGAPQIFIDGKVLMVRVDLAGFAAGQPPYTMTQNDCLIVGDVTFAAANDRDCDGYLVNVDCNDLDKDIHPDAGEVCANNIDDDCDGMKDEESDADGDGQSNCDGDCDDGNKMVFEGATEICDSIDNNCDNKCDDGFDKDGDRHTTCGSKVNADATCSTDMPQPALIDCNDENNHIFGGNSEVCDGLDNDCDTKCDDGFDADNDTYVSCGFDTAACDGVSRPGLRDCNDGDRAINPGAREICNGKDDNCDTKPYPANETCYGVNGTCGQGTRPCDDAPGGAGYGVCNVEAGSGGVQPPMLVCDAYAACSSNPEPLMCTDGRLGMNANVRVVRCQVDYTTAGGNRPTLCPSQKDPFNGPAAANTCLWDVVGGQMQGPYRVGYAATGGQVLQTSAECPTTFQVASFTPAGTVTALPSRRLFLSLSVDAASSTLYSVELIPNLVTACAADGMRCSGANP